MPKLIPDCPSKLEPTPVLKCHREERSYQIELIAPLFGGGVEAGENDPTMPIRGTAIRGQLQFWWRATRGPACATLGELRQRHREVWGADGKRQPGCRRGWRKSSSASRLRARSIAGMPRRAGGRAGGGHWLEPFQERDCELPYVLFPFQGAQPESHRPAEPAELPARCIHHASFSLRLRFPADLLPDVEAAVWAWVNFGGLGARTRRGCGALRCLTGQMIPANAGQIGNWFRQGLGAHLTPQGLSHPSWPALAPRLLVRAESAPTLRSGTG